MGGVTIEINSPNVQEIHWIREMLRQCMVVGRHATDTNIEVVVQITIEINSPNHGECTRNSLD